MHCDAVLAEDLALEIPQWLRWKRATGRQPGVSGAERTPTDPPDWPGWDHYRLWRRMVALWNKSADIPIHKRAELEVAVEVRARQRRALGLHRLLAEDTESHFGGVALRRALTHLRLFLFVAGRCTSQSRSCCCGQSAQLKASRSATRKDGRCGGGLVLTPTQLRHRALGESACLPVPCVARRGARWRTRICAAAALCGKFRP